MTDIDFSEVRALSVSLGQAGQRLPADARKVVSKGALNIKTETIAAIPGRYWGPLKAAVSYTMSGNKFISSAKVGYDDAGQGELAGIYEFGSSRRAPHPTLYPAADAEAPRFEKALADLAAKAIEDVL